MPARRQRLKEQLAPGFIAAMPQLLDPNFHRAVVLLLRHGEGGAFGLVINRPANITVSELCRSQEIPFEGPADQPVMIGGPVETDRHLLVLHGEPVAAGSKPTADLPAIEGVNIVASREALVELLNRGARRYRCYVGYAGWAPGQLDAELAEGAWVPLPVSPQLLFDEPSDEVWAAALRQAGIDPKTLVPGGQLN